MAVIISYERNDVQKGILCDISLMKLVQMIYTFYLRLILSEIQMEMK